MLKSRFNPKLEVNSKKVNGKRTKQKTTLPKIKLRKQTGVNVILQKVDLNPCCPHGPTLLFSKRVKSDTKNFYACAAQRDRKFCSFYLREGESLKNPDIWKQITLNFSKGINHRKLFLILNEVRILKPSERIFCSTCSLFVFSKVLLKHKGHKLTQGITDQHLINPTEILSPCEMDKSEAQYWFSKSAVENIVRIFKSLKYRFVKFLWFC